MKQQHRFFTEERNAETTQERQAQVTQVGLTTSGSTLDRTNFPMNTQYQESFSLAQHLIPITVPAGAPIIYRYQQQAQYPIQQSQHVMAHAANLPYATTSVLVPTIYPTPVDWFDIHFHYHAQQQRDAEEVAMRNRLSQQAQYPTQQPQHVIAHTTTLPYETTGVLFPSVYSTPVDWFDIHFHYHAQQQRDAEEVAMRNRLTQFRPFI